MGKSDIGTRIFLLEAMSSSVCKKIVPVDHIALKLQKSHQQEAILGYEETFPDGNRDDRHAIYDHSAGSCLCSS